MRPLAVAMLLAVGGCGIVTGLSDDYVFVPDDADGGDGGAGEGGSCSVNASGVSSSCKSCLDATSCCALASCLNDSACAEYVRCKNTCTNVSACRRCEDNNATGRAALDTVLQTCAGDCRGACRY